MLSYLFSLVVASLELFQICLTLSTAVTVNVGVGVVVVVGIDVNVVVNVVVVGIDVGFLSTNFDRLKSSEQQEKKKTDFFQIIVTLLEMGWAETFWALNWPGY